MTHWLTHETAIGRGRKVTRGPKGADIDTLQTLIERHCIFFWSRPCPAHQTVKWLKWMIVTMGGEPIGRLTTKAKANLFSFWRMFHRRVNTWPFPMDGRIFPGCGVGCGRRSWTPHESAAISYLKLTSHEFCATILHMTIYANIVTSSRSHPCMSPPLCERARPSALRDKTGSHGPLAIFQLYEVIFPIGNHPTGQTCIFSNSAWKMQHFEGCYMSVD